MLVSALVAYRSTGSTVFVPRFLGYLAWAYAELGQFDDTQGCTVEAITTTEITKESWNQADIHCIAGDIALRLPDRGQRKQKPIFERALTIAREQQAKSWELRAAMSMARSGQAATGPRCSCPGLWLVH